MQHTIKILKILTVIVIVLLVIVGTVYVWQGKKPGKGASDAIYVRAVKTISSVMVVPNDVPKVATVGNADEVKTNDPDFFKNAKEGDIVFTYLDRAILFNPKTQKIVNIKTYPPPLALPTQPLRIALRYNGIETDRIKALKDELVRTSPNFQVTEVAASRAVYREDVIYLVNNARRDDATALAQALGGSKLFDVLEKNEAKTDADLIIAFRAL